MRPLILMILLCLCDISYGQAVWNGKVYNAPVCNNPNCAMCDAIRAQLAARAAPTPTTSTPTQEYVTQYETRAVVRQVKRCNGRVCWFEDVTEYVQVPIQVPVSKSASKSTPVSTPRPMYPPKSDISLDLVPTPEAAIPILVSLLRPTPDDVFMEPGCGDGRILAAVSKICPSIGIELNKDTAKIAIDNLAKDATIYRRSTNTTVLVGDATQADYTRATIVSMYLYPDVMEKIVPLLQPGTRVVSYCHTIPGIKCTEYTTNGHTFYVGVK